MTKKPDNAKTYKQERRAERNARILEWHRKGIRHDAIATRIGLTPTRVYQILKGNGIYVRGPYRRAA